MSIVRQLSGADEAALFRVYPGMNEQGGTL